LYSLGRSWADKERWPNIRLANSVTDTTNRPGLELYSAKIV
jgi:hypothetical protein